CPGDVVTYNRGGRAAQAEALRLAQAHAVAFSSASRSGDDGGRERPGVGQQEDDCGRVGASHAAKPDSTDASFVRIMLGASGEGERTYRSRSYPEAAEECESSLVDNGATTLFQGRNQ